MFLALIVTGTNISVHFGPPAAVEGTWKDSEEWPKVKKRETSAMARETNEFRMVMVFSEFR